MPKKIYILFASFFISCIIFFTALSTSNKSEKDVKTTQISLKDLVSNAAPNDTITLNGGYYPESGIEIYKPLTIIGKNDPVIDGQSKGKNIFLIKNDSVSLAGLTIKNVARHALWDNAAIRIDNSHQCKVLNCKFENAYFGIYLAKSSNCEVIGNKFQSQGSHESDAGNGIHLWKSGHIHIKDNVIKGHRDGIYLEFGKACMIENNWSENNIRYGLHFMFSDSCKYLNNHFEHNGAGVAVMYTHDIEMINNTFANNWGTAAYGLLLKDIHDSKIYGNQFVNNTVGIHSEGSIRIKVEHNNFIRNGWGARIFANSNDNFFGSNNFISNTFDIASNSRMNFNKFIGNYWSGYSGYDINLDGWGDVPYRPVRLFSLLASQQEPVMLLLHSIFIEFLDIAERIFPVLTPETLIDSKPSMKIIK
ncbi:MAG: nitrous oxide reductase family maturation protein NosD [Candidatus Kapabacteria bacterium]|nr:nitrous oxide reductase family maturation protein NosD [Candidatus Kapabacteria bacterium]